MEKNEKKNGLLIFPIIITKPRKLDTMPLLKHIRWSWMLKMSLEYIMYPLGTNRDLH